MNVQSLVRDAVQSHHRPRVTGEIVAVSGQSITARVPTARIGDLCSISLEDSVLQCLVVGFREDLVFLAPCGPTTRIAPRAPVVTSCNGLRIPVGDALKGRIVDPMCRPLDGRPLPLLEHRDVFASPPPPLSRRSIDTILETGVRSIDGLLTLGRGQRIGLFAGAGLGKSTLLSILARNAKADVAVIALVGERGREVSEFVHETLGEAGLENAVIVVATSDAPSFTRQLAPLTATAIAEHFRDQGMNVLLLVDSLSRFARAIRETSIAAGELPVRHGYTNSVYTMLPELIERAGNSSEGSITAIYTVLTNGDDEIDPLGEEAKSLLDGHIVLSNRSLANGIRPAIDVPSSISRLFTKLHSPSYVQAAELVTRALRRLSQDRDLVMLGGQPDHVLAKAMSNEETLRTFLNQLPSEVNGLDVTQEQIRSLSIKLI